MYLTIVSLFWVCYDHSIRGNVKFVTNYGLSLAQVNWNFVDRFLDVQQGPCISRQRASHGSLLRTINRSSDLMPKQFKMWIEITDPFSNLTGLAAQWSVEMDK